MFDTGRRYPRVRKKPLQKKVCSGFFVALSFLEKNGTAASLTTPTKFLLMNTETTSSSNNSTPDQTTPESATGETLSRVAEEGGIEPTQRPHDPTEEKDEMHRDADAGAGS